MSSEVALRQSPYLASGPEPVVSTDAQTPPSIGVNAGVPLGRTAGTTATTYDATSVDHDGDTTTSANGEPTATQWRQLGMTERDVAYLRGVGMQGSQLRSFFDTVASQVNQRQNPGPVQGEDPLAGTPLEGTGLLVDTQSGVAYDPSSGRVFDPQSGAELDPYTGEAISSGPEGAAAAPGAGNTGPGWNPDYATKYTKLFTEYGLPPELAATLVEGVQASNLSAAELDAGLQYYGTADGKAELAQIRTQFEQGASPMDYVKLLAPVAAVGVGVAGAGAVAYRAGRNRVASGAEELVRAANATGTDAKTVAAREAAQAKIDAGGMTSRRAQAMTNAGSDAMQARGGVGLQLMMERDGSLPVGEHGSISPKITKLLNDGVVGDELKALAQKAEITVIPGETSYSLANRIAQKNGVGLTNAAAKAFVTGAETKPFNGISGAGFRSYAPKVPVGADWAAYRAAADNMGVGLMHPMEKLRLVTQANAVGPEATAIKNLMQTAAADGTKAPGLLRQLTTGAGAGIEARGAEATLLSGSKGILTGGLKSMTGKMGVVGAIATAGFEVPEVAHVIGEHGIDSKEAGNAIGGATGRVAGNLAGFAVGTAVGSIATSAIMGSAIGTMIPVPIVGTVVGGAIGLGVGIAVSMGASKVLGGVGEHVGDALSWVNEKTGIGDVLGGVNNLSNKVDQKLDETAKTVEDTAHKIVPFVPEGALHAGVKGAEHIVKTVVNPIGAIKDTAKAAKDVGGKIVDGIKGLFS
jgi:hypothetical protein